MPDKEWLKIAGGIKNSQSLYPQLFISTGRIREFPPRSTVIARLFAVRAPPILRHVFFSNGTLNTTERAPPSLKIAMDPAHLVLCHPSGSWGRGGPSRPVLAVQSGGYRRNAAGDGSRHQGHGRSISQHLLPASGMYRRGSGVHPRGESVRVTSFGHRSEIAHSSPLCRSFSPAGLRFANCHRRLAHPGAAPWIEHCISKFIFARRYKLPANCRRRDQLGRHGAGSWKAE